MQPVEAPPHVAKHRPQVYPHARRKANHRVARRTRSTSPGTDSALVSAGVRLRLEPVPACPAPPLPACSPPARNLLLQPHVYSPKLCPQKYARTDNPLCSCSRSVAATVPDSRLAFPCTYSRSLVPACASGVRGTLTHSVGGLVIWESYDRQAAFNCPAISIALASIPRI